MEIEFSFDIAWHRIMDYNGGDSTGLAREAANRGMRAAVVCAVDEVEEIFKRRGRPRWKALSPEYKKRKRRGKAAPGLQLNSTRTGLADLKLTGQLFTAAVLRPKVIYTRNMATIMPDLQVSFGGTPLAKYAKAVNETRPYYNIPKRSHAVIAKKYAQEYINTLNGVPVAASGLRFSFLLK